MPPNLEPRKIKLIKYWTAARLASALQDTRHSLVELGRNIRRPLFPRQSKISWNAPSRSPHIQIIWNSPGLRIRLQKCDCGEIWRWNYECYIFFYKSREGGGRQRRVGQGPTPLTDDVTNYRLPNEESGYHILGFNEWYYGVLCKQSIALVWLLCVVPKMRRDPRSGCSHDSPFYIPLAPEKWLYEIPIQPT